MKKVFWDDPYQTSLKTTVSEVHGNTLLFAETIIFSFSGGQESDRGLIHDREVLSSQIKGNLIYYTLEEGHGFSVGDAVVMHIDWSRRYKLMRYHFAAELILEIVTKKLHAEKIGAHIAENKARIDFMFDRNISQVFDSALMEFNTIIANNLPINTGFSDVNSQRRYWEIAGFSKVSCGGTHVKSTAEVGYVTLKRVNIGKGKERIEIILAE